MKIDQKISGASAPADNRKPAHPVGSLDGFPLNRIRTVQVEGRDVGIIRTEHSVYAIGNKCPHQGGPMCQGKLAGTMVPSEPNQYVYDHDGLVVQCPWHAYEFHVDTGESVAGAVKGRVPVFEVFVEDGEVYCALNRPTPREVVR
jgi:nitrite reductase (NADH) small subunit